MGLQNGNPSRKTAAFLWFPAAQTCTTMGPSLDCLPPSVTMSSNRPNLTRPHPTEPDLTLDEQSFQSLLSAAFTIQEHNDRRGQAHRAEGELEIRRQPEAAQLPANISEQVCAHCGAPKSAEEERCPSCGLDELRPGERMQRNWASMWLMSQEKGLWPERSAETRDAARNEVAPNEVARSQVAQNQVGRNQVAQNQVGQNQVGRNAAARSSVPPDRTEPRPPAPASASPRSLA